MANPNIFQAYLQRPRSVLDYEADLDQADVRKQTMQGNALQLAASRMKLDEGVQAGQRAASLRSAVASLPSAATDEQRIQAMRATGTPEGFAQADSLEKSLVERRKGNAAAGKDEAEAAAKAADMRFKAADHHAQGLSYVQSPEDVVTYVDQGIAKGVFPMAAREQMLQKAQAMVQQMGLDGWKQAAAQAAIPVVEKFKQDAEQKRAQLVADTSRANNAETNRTSITTTSMREAGDNARHNSTQAAANQAVTYQPDGSGGFVALPSKLAPGQAPTGRVAVDATTGAPIKSKDGGGPKISSEVQRQIGGVLSFDKDLGALEAALKEFNPRNPLDQADTTKRARLTSLAKQAQLSAKEAAALGALSGPDMMLLEGILNDPTTIKGAVAGSKGLAAQIAEARAGNKRRVQSLGQQYGNKATDGLPENLRGDPAAPGLPAAPSAVQQAADEILKGGKPKGFARGGPVGVRVSPAAQQYTGEATDEAMQPGVPSRMTIQPYPTAPMPAPGASTWQPPSRVDGVPQGLSDANPLVAAAGRMGRPGMPNRSMAYYDGGEVVYEEARREPVVGSKAPVRFGGTGGGMSQNALLRAVAAIPDAPTASRGRADPMNPRAVMAAREQRADLTAGGAALGGPPGRDTIPAALNNGEHVLTTDEVTALGEGDNALGQQRLMQWRASLRPRIGAR